MKTLVASLAVLLVAAVSLAAGSVSLPAEASPPPAADEAVNVVPAAPGWSAPVNVSSNPGSSGAPVLVAESSGVLHALWYDNTPANWDILFASRSLTGFWSVPENVSLNASYSLVPHGIVDRHDALHVVWQDYGGPLIAFQGTLLFRSRQPDEDFGATEAISATSGFGGYPEVRDPQLTVDSNNVLHLVWAGSTVQGYRIFYATRGADGEWSVPAVIIPGTGNAFFPRIGIDSADGLHVVYQELRADSTRWRLYYTHRPAGGVWSAPESVTESDTNAQSPTLLVEPNGTLHVAWRGELAGLSAAEILYSRRVVGEPWTGPDNLSQTEGDSAGPSLAIDEYGTLHAAWYDNTPGNWDVLYAAKPPMGVWNSASNVSQSPGRSGQPHLLYDGKGRLHLVWSDDSGGNLDVYYVNKTIPSFSLSAKEANAGVLPGESIAYSLIVRNAYTMPLALTVTDTLPAETSYVEGSAQASAGSVVATASQVLWSGLVPAGGQVRITFRALTAASVPVGTLLRNSALIADGSGTTLTVEATTRVLAARIVAPIIVSSRSP